MTRAMRVVRVSFFIILLMLVAVNAAMGQPAMQYYNVSGENFISNCQTAGKESYSAGCISTNDSCSKFSFPVNLPNGSTVKYVEMLFIRHNQSDILNDNFLFFTLIEPGNYLMLLADIKTSGLAGATVQKKKSTELNYLIDNQNYFYSLFYEAYSVDSVEFCGARIYYYPPSSLSYLPLIKNK